MKKHLTVAHVVELMNNPANTMGDNVHCVVVVNGVEYPVVGIEPYSGVFCRLFLGAPLSDDNVRRIDDDVFVKEN